MRIHVFAAPLAACLALATIRFVSAAGFATSDNFTVFSPGQGSPEQDRQFAEQVLERAERYRAAIAREWLGEELPPSVGRTTINVGFSATSDSGRTWARDDARRKYHAVYLTTSPERALGATLAHEMVHVVLATRYPHPDRLAAWIEEGIASRYDDAESKRTRQRILGWFVSSGNWPRLHQVLLAENIAAQEQQHYAVAESLTEYLLGLRPAATLLQFGETLHQQGIDAALERHYGIASVDQLQRDWQRWVVASRQLAARSSLTADSLATADSPAKADSHTTADSPATAGLPVSRR